MGVLTSGSGYIYDVYCIFHSICQEVNLVPHEQMDEIQDVTAIFLKMMKVLGHSDCPEKCLWSRYHADLLKMENQKKFMGSEVKRTNIDMLRQRRLYFVDVQLSVADGIVMAKEWLSILTWRLHNDLSSEGFDDGTKEVIKNYRVICVLKSLLVNIYMKRGAMVGSEETKTILNGVRSKTGSVRLSTMTIWWIIIECCSSRRNSIY